MDNSPSNRNVPDPRNWQGAGNRSVANMFIDLGNRVSLTDEQFKEEMAKRRAAQSRTRTCFSAARCAPSAAGRREVDSASNSSSNNRRH